MSRRARGVLADYVEDMCDKPQADTTFDTFVQNMLDLTFQEICSFVPWSRWLLDEASLNATADGTQYITIPSDMDIDSIISITDRSNSNRKVRRITPQGADEIDPGRDLSGDEIVWWYQRVETGGGAFEDRIYFLHQPDSADTLSAIFGVLPPIPSGAGSNYVLPEKYEWILIEGALEKAWNRLDVDSDRRSNKHREKFNTGIQIILRDANSIQEESGLMGHRPLRGGASVSGPSFPSNYDVSP